MVVIAKPIMASGPHAAPSLPVVSDTHDAARAVSPRCAGLSGEFLKSSRKPLRQEGVCTRDGFPTQGFVCSRRMIHAETGDAEGRRRSTIRRSPFLCFGAQPQHLRAASGAPGKTGNRPYPRSPRKSRPALVRPRQMLHVLLSPREQFLRNGNPRGPPDRSRQCRAHACRIRPFPGQPCNCEGRGTLQEWECYPLELYRQIRNGRIPLCPRPPAQTGKTGRHPGGSCRSHPPVFMARFRVRRQASANAAGLLAFLHCFRRSGLSRRRTERRHNGRGKCVLRTDGFAISCAGVQRLLLRPGGHSHRRDARALYGNASRRRRACEKFRGEVRGRRARQSSTNSDGSRSLRVCTSVSVLRSSIAPVSAIAASCASASSATAMCSFSAARPPPGPPDPSKYSAPDKGSCARLKFPASSTPYRCNPASQVSILLLRRLRAQRSLAGLRFHRPVPLWLRAARCAAIPRERGRETGVREWLFCAVDRKAAHRRHYRAALRSVQTWSRHRRTRQRWRVSAILRRPFSLSRSRSSIRPHGRNFSPSPPLKPCAAAGASQV